MATYFAVGAPFTHDGVTNHYATTTGGSATVAAPTTADTVTVDANSGTGTIDFTANFSCSTFTMNNVNITLAPAAQTLTIAGSWTWTAGSFTAGTSQITMTGTGTFAGAGKTYWNYSSTSTGTVVLTGNNTFNNFSRVPTAGLSILQCNGTTTTVNGVLTFTGVAVTAPLWVAGYDANAVAGAGVAIFALGTTGTIAATTDVDFSDITITGTAAPLTGTRIGNAGNITGITADASRSLFWVGNGGSWSSSTKWSLTSGGASGQNPPKPQDDVTFDANSITSAAQTITWNMRHPGRNVDMSGVLNNPSNTGSTTQFFCGNVKAGTMTGIGTAAWVFFGKGAQTSTMNGYQHNVTMQYQCTGGTYTMQDNHTTTAGLSILNGGFDMNGKNYTAATLTSSTATSATVKNIHLRSGTLTLTGTGTVINISSMASGNFSADTSTVVISDTSVTTKTIQAGGATVLWNNVTITGGGTGAVVQSAGAGQTFNWTGVLTINGPKTVTWHNTFLYNSATGQTTYGTINVVGTLGNTVTMNTDLAGTRATLRLGTGSNTAAFGAFQDIYASSNMIDATNNGTDSGNNSGVIFTRTENRYEGMLGVGN